MDEFSRKCLAIKVGYNSRSDDVLDVLSCLFITEAIPSFIRSDNGSEFTAKILQDWLKGLKVETAYITPGSPWRMVLMRDLTVALGIIIKWRIIP